QHAASIGGIEEAEIVQRSVVVGIRHRTGDTGGEDRGVANRDVSLVELHLTGLRVAGRIRMIRGILAKTKVRGRAASVVAVEPAVAVRAMTILLGLHVDD